MYNQISGALFKEMIFHGADAVTAQKQAINDLNVFPVPDGDTGTNMSMTIQAAVTELGHHNAVSVGEAAGIAASAMLRGARGNSGVILSLLFRGISKSLKGKNAADAADLAAALQEGVATAYSAVMKPAEGTILTVSRLAAEKAISSADAGASLEDMLVETIAQAEETLAQTIDMNPVLKKAGVVDAGGKGFLLILGGMLNAVRGEERVRPEADAPQEKANFNVFSTEEITFAFDTVFIVRKTAELSQSLEPLRAYLGSIGDSLVIGEDDEAFKVHVHTNTPGDALNEAQKYGVLELAKIENMRTQYDDVAAGKKAQSVDDLEDEDCGEEPAPAVAAPEKAFGFLAVCAGDGLTALFKDLGADAVVSGGQTMNPSTESILSAVNQVPAETVFILPNNKNIIMAAQQCIGLTEKHVVVIPSASVPQGITAMMNVNYDAESAGEIEQAMTESLSAVSTAQITYAARSSDFDGFTINEGDYLALLDGKLFGTDRGIAALGSRLAEAAKESDAHFISLFYGSDVSEDEAQKMGEAFSAVCGDAEISVLSGGQPVYYYIISIE